MSKLNSNFFSSFQPFPSQGTILGPIQSFLKNGHANDVPMIKDGASANCLRKVSLEALQDARELYERIKVDGRTLPEPLAFDPDETKPRKERIWSLSTFFSSPQGGHGVFRLSSHRALEIACLEKDRSHYTVTATSPKMSLSQSIFIEHARDEVYSNYYVFRMECDNFENATQMATHFSRLIYLSETYRQSDLKDFSSQSAVQIEIAPDIHGLKRNLTVVLNRPADFPERTMPLKGRLLETWNFFYQTMVSMRILRGIVPDDQTPLGK